MRKDIVKITGTFLGYEDHGILTAMLTVDYGKGGGQGVGGYCLDEPTNDDEGRFVKRLGTAYGMEFVARVVRACGVDSWEKVAGRTVYVLQDLDDDALVWGTNKVLGIENLPTERGEQFLFADLAAEFQIGVDS